MMDDTGRRRWPPWFAESGTSGLGGPVASATVLVVGLFAVAPALGWVLAATGVSPPLPLLAGVIVVGSLYALFVVSVGRLAQGAAVALVTTATMAADFPLAANVDAYPGSLGPEVWLVHAPLGALLVLLAVRGALSPRSFGWIEYAMAAFVAWSALVALVGPVPRVDTALYYALYALVGFLAFGAVAWSVAAGVVDLRGVIGAFLVTIGGHVAFAAVQLANQGPLGLTVLGETLRATSHTVVGLGPVGFNIGVFVSGLAGGSGAFSMLLVVALPLALAVAVERRGWQRAGVLSGAVAVAAVLRFTAKDASRGAVIVAVALFGGFLLWEHRDRLTRRAGSLRRAGRWAPLSLATVAALFVPSTINARTSGAGSSGGAGAGSGAGETSATGAASVDVSVPFFNLNTLGVRLQQYLVGLDIFVGHPLTGVGGANFVYVAARYPVEAIEGFPLHNLYLSLLVGTGIPGFALYSLALLGVLWSGWRLFSSSTADRVLVAGTLAALVGYLAAAFWAVPLRFTHAVPFWVLAGAVVGEHRRTSGISRSDE